MPRTTERPIAALTDEQRERAAEYFPWARGVVRVAALGWVRYFDEIESLGDEVLVLAAASWSPGTAGDFMAYFRVLFRSRMLDFLRRRLRQATVWKSWHQVECFEPSRVEDPTAAIDMADWIETAKRALNPAQGRTLEQLVELGLKQAEIAEADGIGAPGVSTRVMKLREALRSNASLMDALQLA
jgi:DNA-directed RNA polymerase specialized sigma24 family protein